MSNIVIAGGLDFLSLADLVQLLGTNGSTGILSITSRYAPETGLIYFKNGNPVNATTSSSAGIEAVYQLFGWVEGRFEFSQEDVEIEKVIHLGRMEIILNGLRMLDDNNIERLSAASYKKKTFDFKDADIKAPLIKISFVDYMYVVDEEEFFDGERIIEQGKHGNWIWVILEGIVNVVKETPQGKMVIYRLGEGAFVGDIASLLLRDNVRIVTAEAAGNVQLGVLDAQRLTSEFACLDSGLREVIKSLDKRLGNMISAVGRLSKIINQDNFFKEKKQVVNHGANDKKLYIIKQGKAYVVRHEDDSFVPMITLETGDIFGNYPFFDFGHEPNGASVYGSKDLEIKALDVNNIQKEYENIPSMFKKIIENVATCISGATILACEFLKKSDKQP